MTTMAPTVDVLCATYNGAPYLSAFVDSLRAQDGVAWRLWLRDDGSTDGTREQSQALAATDPRIRLVDEGGARLGAALSFGRLLAEVAPACAYVMFADQDDVWLPGKLSRSMAAMRTAEATGAGPVLVHSDLRVVDAALGQVAPSFWRLCRIHPEPATLERIAVHGVVTGATILMNRALVERVVPVPTDAVMHDWWCACVAAASGRIVAMHEPTVLYRQHGENVVGAAAPAWEGSVGGLPSRISSAFARRADARASIDETARQAIALLARVGAELTPAERDLLEDMGHTLTAGWWGRKRRLLRWRVRREFGVLRNLGILVRG